MEEKKYPEVLRTKEDYEYVRQNFPREFWEKDFEELLSDGYEYKVVGIIPDEWYGTERTYGDDISKVIKISDKKAQTVLAHQDEWESKEIDFEITHVRWNGKTYLVVFVPNPNAKINRVGYTVDELINILYPIEDYTIEADNIIGDINIDNLSDDAVIDLFNKLHNKGEENDGYNA